MTDTTELVARLRDQQDMIQLGEDAYEAADAIERLTRERDEARAAALEEAAKVAETQRRKVLFIRSGCHPTADHDDYERLTYAADHLEDAAAAIRALKETPHD